MTATSLALNRVTFLTTNRARPGRARLEPIEHSAWKTNRHSCSVVTCDIDSGLLESISPTRAAVEQPNNGTISSPKDRYQCYWLLPDRFPDHIAPRPFSNLTGSLSIGSHKNLIILTVEEHVHR